MFAQPLTFYSVQCVKSAGYVVFLHDHFNKNIVSSCSVNSYGQLNFLINPELADLYFQICWPSLHLKSAHQVKSSDGTLIIRVRSKYTFIPISTTPSHTFVHPLAEMYFLTSRLFPKMQYPHVPSTTVLVAANTPGMYLEPVYNLSGSGKAFSI